MRKGGRLVGHRRRQGNPQLGRMQARTGRDRVFGVRNAVACRHQVHLTGAHHLFRAQAVAVQDFALDHPGEGLQPGVRVGPHMHALAGRKIHRPQVVQKTPGADHAPPPGGQDAGHRHTLPQAAGAGNDAFGRDGGFGHGAGLLVGHIKHATLYHPAGLPGVIQARQNRRHPGRGAWVPRCQPRATIAPARRAKADSDRSSAASDWRPPHWVKWRDCERWYWGS